MPAFISNSILFVIFAFLAYYFDMPKVTIFGFGFWVAIWILSDSYLSDRIAEIAEKTNFLLRGEDDHTFEVKKKIDELEEKLTNVKKKVTDLEEKLEG